MRAALFLALAAAAARAGKERYDLLNPVPRSEMRPLSADRPDVTESPYTVDAGHVQIEVDLFLYQYDRANEDRARRRLEGYSIAPFNLKIGLYNHGDLQIGFDPYTRLEGDDLDAGTSGVSEGIGDVVVRFKLNMWGNDGGDTALAVMPFVKIPTAEDALGNDEVEAGVVIPFAWDVGSGWSLGAQVELSAVRNDEDDGRDLQVLQSVAISRAIFGDLSAFAEIVSVVDTGGGPWRGSANAGVAWLVTEDLQLDGGARYGLSRASPDFEAFVGLTIRF